MLLELLALYLYLHHVVLLSSSHFSKYNDLAFPLSLRQEAVRDIKEMFSFSFDSYMKYAFPHDELKPVTGTFTDSLPELGNAKNTNKLYKGLSLTLIDALDTLLLFNRTQSFIEAYRYLSSSIESSTHHHSKQHKNDSTKHKFPGFNIDIRVHVFETNIRLLGGLLSAHCLSTHPKWTKQLFSAHDADSVAFLNEYNDEFLILAQDLGDRLLAAFNTTNSIPYAWINLKRGILKGETRDTCTAGVGTVMLEMSLLSYLTQNDRYFLAAHKALLRLWKLRNVDNNLLGNSFNGGNLRWTNTNSGIGAGIDSFYEYLLKSYIYLGVDYYWDMFQVSYNSALKYLRKGPWYIETNVKTSRPSHYHFNSLQSFWPSLQIMIGDIPLALSTINSFFSIWYTYNGLPERFLLNSNQPHSTENQYPLRPELIESIFYAFQAIQNNNHQMTKVVDTDNQLSLSQDYYLWLGMEILKSIQNRTKTKFGYTILDNVITGDQGDYMPSYFLAETCKYLLLLFDDQSPLHQMESEYIFTTEGHIFPVYNDMRTYIESILVEKEPKLQDLQDEVFIHYEKYRQFDRKSKSKQKVNKSVEKQTDTKTETKSKDKDKDKDKNKKNDRNTANQQESSDLPATYNSRSIINSNNIESIFIYQHPYNAVCPNKPFYYYMLMHHDAEAVVYNTHHIDMHEAEEDENGMNYLWKWIHKMFGPKDEVYRNKQLSTIRHDGTVQMEDQCEMPPVQLGIHLC